MAKVTITLKDQPDGTVKIEVVFKPPAKKNQKPTNAQYGAIVMLEASKQAAESQKLTSVNSTKLKE